jgi:hypothetical protein
MATAPIAHIFCQIMPGPPELDWWHRVLTNPSDSFAGALAVLTAFLVIIGWLQGCQLKRSVEVAKDAAESATAPPPMSRSGPPWLGRWRASTRL